MDWTGTTLERNGGTGKGMKGVVQRPLDRLDALEKTP
jgi:hypothetical protein